jgi:hypothetical protein
MSCDFYLFFNLLDVKNIVSITIIQCRYCRDEIVNYCKHKNSLPNRYNEVSEEDKAIRNKWFRHKRLFLSPSVVDDDLYIIYASLFNRSPQYELNNNNNNGKSGNGEVSENSGCQGGGGGDDGDDHKQSLLARLRYKDVDSKLTRVITNDQLRDHWCHLLPLVPYDHYYESQVVKFGLTNDALYLRYPAIYSSVAQCSDSIGRGTLKRSWHLPTAGRAWLLVEMDIPPLV